MEQTKLPTYEEIHDRNYGIYSKEEQDKIRKAKVAIIGQGCVGEVEAVVLAKIGVGNLTISDFDEYEPANMNRNLLARVSVLGKRKADVVESFLKDAEPYININRIGKIEEENALESLTGQDIILQAVDDMPTRVIVHRAAKQLGIPVVTMSGAPPYRSIVSTFMSDGIDYEVAFGLPTKGKSFADPKFKKEIGIQMRDARAAYAATAGADPTWAKKHLSGERRIWSVTPERAYSCAVDCAHEAVKYIIGKEDKVVKAPDALIIDKTGKAFKDFGIEYDGILEMIVKDALIKIPEIYRRF